MDLVGGRHQVDTSAERAFDALLRDLGVREPAGSPAIALARLAQNAYGLAACGHIKPGKAKRNLRRARTALETLASAVLYRAAVTSVDAGLDGLEDALAAIERLERAQP